MKTSLSARVETYLANHAKQQPNTSRYIEQLIKNDFHSKNQEPLYQALIERLLKDDEVLPVLAKKLNQSASRPVTKESDGGVIVENPDWGA